MYIKTNTTNKIHYQIFIGSKIILVYENTHQNTKNLQPRNNLYNTNKNTNPLAKCYMCIEYNIMIGVVNKIYEICTLLFALYSKGWDKNYLKICYNPAFILPKRSASICFDFFFSFFPSRSGIFIIYSVLSLFT